MTRFTTNGLIAVSTLIGGAALVSAWLPASENVPSTIPAAKRLREGTRLQDVAGRFEGIGEKVNFVLMDTGESLRVLENLALERVSLILPSEGQQKLQWSVSGTVTEYKGGNYLLLTKAVQSAKAPSDPEKASGIGTPSKGDYSGPQAKPTSAKSPEKSNDRPR